MTKHDMVSLTLIILCGLSLINCVFGSLYILLVHKSVGTALTNFVISLALGLWFIYWFIARESRDTD